MNVPVFLAAAGVNPGEAELLYVWRQATPEGKAVIFCLLILSIVAWSVMIAKVVQMHRAKKLNRFFNAEYRTQKNVLDVFDRRVQAEGCPLFMVYQAGSLELDARLKNPDGNGRKKFVSLKGMEHVKRSMENTVAQESLKLESGLILLANAVSGAPFLGLLGTVWGVMSTFGHIAQQGVATMAAMAPGVPPLSSPPSPVCWSRFPPCSLTICWCTTCACSRSSWTTLRRNWCRRWRPSTLKRNEQVR